jgi:anti-anti-sigma factor
MWGEHDLSTDGALCQTLARAIALDRFNLVLDLSDVSLLSASTLGIIVAARELLGRQSRSLTVRSPSAFVRRIIGVCALDDLFSPSRRQGSGGAGEALGSWVGVPPAERDPQPSSSPALVPLQVEVGPTTHLAVRVAMELERLAEIA